MAISVTGEKVKMYLWTASNSAYLAIAFSSQLRRFLWQEKDIREKSIPKQNSANHAIKLRTAIVK